MPNGRWSGTEPTEAKCIACGKVQTSIYPGCWGRSPGLNYLLLDRPKCVGLCGGCVTPANLSAYWQATLPVRAVAK
jgi:hypothetical protein